MLNRSKVHPVLIVLVLLISACFNRQNMLSTKGAKGDSEPATVPSSFKTADEKATEGQKNQPPPSKPIINAKLDHGNCVYGCMDPDLPGSKKEEIAGKEVSQDYILGPEDIIDVSVWKNESLSRTVLIRPDGKISLPLIGDVQAAGLDTSQLRDSIKEKLKEYKETPEVSIIVKEINSFVVFVTGEVAHPGKLMLRSDTSILQAIVLAGGFTQFASPNKIVLLRRVGGIESRRQIRYKDIVSGKKPEVNILLQRGDTIVVP